MNNIKSWDIYILIFTIIEIISIALFLQYHWKDCCHYCRLLFQNRPPKEPDSLIYEWEKYCEKTKQVSTFRIAKGGSAYAGWRDYDGSKIEIISNVSLNTMVSFVKSKLFLVEEKTFYVCNSFVLNFCLEKTFL